MPYFDTKVQRWRDARGRFAKPPRVKPSWRAEVRYRIKNIRDYDIITFEFTGQAAPTEEEVLSLARVHLNRMRGLSVIPFDVISLVKI